MLPLQKKGWGSLNQCRLLKVYREPETQLMKNRFKPDSLVSFRLLEVSYLPLRQINEQSRGYLSLLLRVSLSYLFVPGLEQHVLTFIHPLTVLLVVCNFIFFTPLTKRKTSSKLIWNVIRLPSNII